MAYRASQGYLGMSVERIEELERRMRTHQPEGGLEDDGKGRIRVLAWATDAELGHADDVRELADLRANPHYRAK